MGVMESGLGNLFVLIGIAYQLVLPNGIPPGHEDPTMFKIAPQKCMFYTSWAGTAQPDPNSQNHTEQLLAEQKVQESLQVWNQIAGRMLAQRANFGEPNADKDAAEIAQLVMSNPGAVFITNVRRAPEKLQFQGGLIANLGKNAERVRDLLKKHQSIFFGAEAKPVQEGNTTWYRVQPDGPAITFGTHDSYLIVGIGDQAVEDIVNRMDGNPPQWLTDIHGRLPVKKRATTIYVNTNGIREFLSSWIGAKGTQQILDSIGLSNVHFVANVTGLDDNGFISRSFSDIQGQPRGLFAIGDQQPLKPADLALVPKDVITADVFRFDPGQFWDTIDGVLKNVNRPAYDRLQARINFVEQRANVNFRHDIVPTLGNTFCIFDTGAKDQTSSRKPLVERHPLSGFAFVATVHDAQRLESLVGQLSQAFDGALGSSAHRTETQVNGHKMVELHLADSPNARSFAWALTEQHLVVSTSADTVREFLNRASQSDSLADVHEVAELFKADQAPVAIAYSDAARTYDRSYPDLQYITGILEAVFPPQNGQAEPLLAPREVVSRHLQPTIGAVRWGKGGVDTFVRQTIPSVNAGISGPLALEGLYRGAQLTEDIARRDASAENLQKISAALIAYERVNNKFPAPAIRDAEGRPLLSWRVLILPMLGHDELYRQFRLNEPWNSPHNRQLIGQMPEVFRSPLSKSNKGRTTYLAITGDNTVFSSESNPLANAGQQGAATAMLVEGSDWASVEWTQPEDLPFDPAAPKVGLIGLGRTGFLVALSNGRVRFVSAQATPDAIDALFTIGEHPAPLTAREPRESRVRE